MSLVSTAHRKHVVRSLADTSGAKTVVVSLSNEGVIGWDGTQVIQQPALPVEVIDRIGAGDALACGVLHGWFNGDLALGLRYGVTLAALALSQHGDAVITTPRRSRRTAANYPYMARFSAKGDHLG